MGFWQEVSLKTATGTWIGHGLLTLAVGIVLSIFGGDLGFLFGVTGMAVYYAFVREEQDKEGHIEAGDYDTPQYGQGVTPRVDKVGDSIAPVSIAVGAWAGFIVNLIT